MSTERRRPAGVALDLRRRAEARLRRSSPAPAAAPAPPEEDLRKLLHELQVHQVELELQHEQLLATQQELDAARARWFELFDLAPVGYLTLSGEGSVLEANLAAAALLDVERRALIGRPLVRFVARADQDGYRRYLALLLAAAGSRDCRIRLLRAGGAPFHARLDAVAARTGEGPAAFRLSLIDLTEQVAAEQALRESEERFRGMSALTSEGIVIHADHRVLDANQAFAELVGRASPDELLGQSGLDFIPFAGDSKQDILGHLDSGSVAPFEVELLRPDGSVRTVETRGRPVCYRGRTARLVSLNDVSERRRAEHERQRATEFLESIINAIADPIFVLDRQRRIVLTNEALCRLVGRPRRALLGCTEQDLFPPEQAQELRRVVEQVLATGEEVTTEQQIRTATGEVRVHLDKKTRFVDAQGELFLVVVVIDITERRRAQERAESLARFPAEDPSPVLRIRRDGTLLYVNEGGTRLLPGWGLYTGTAVARRLRQATSQALRSESATTIEFEHRGRFFSMVVAPVAGKDYVNVYGTEITALKLAEQRLQEFSRLQLALREDDRRRLATALHHDLGSLAVSVAGRLEAAADAVAADRPALAQESLAAGGELLRASVARLKLIAIDLRPPDLELLGLATALRQHMARVSKDTGLRIRFVDASGGRWIDPDAAIVLYRVGQAALTNVARHAQATRVSVRLAALRASVRLVVQDDGRGFDATATLRPARGAMGLTSMREMAAMVGGTTAIDSGPGRGTRVTTTLPYRWREG